MAADASQGFALVTARTLYRLATFAELTAPVWLTLAAVVLA